MGGPVFGPVRPLIFGAEFPLPRRGWGWVRPAWPQAEGHVGIQATEGRNEITARGRPGYATAISGIRKMAFSFDEGRRIGGTGSMETAGADGPDFVDIPLLLPPPGPSIFEGIGLRVR